MPMLHSKHWFILLKLFSYSSKSYNYIYKSPHLFPWLAFSISGALECIPSSWFLSYQGATLNQNPCINLSFCPHNSLPVHASSQSRRRRMSSTSCLQTVQKYKWKSEQSQKKIEKLKHRFPIPPEIPEKFRLRSLPPFHHTVYRTKDLVGFDGHCLTIQLALMEGWHRQAQSADPNPPPSSPIRLFYLFSLVLGADTLTLDDILPLVCFGCSLFVVVFCLYILGDAFLRISRLGRSETKIPCDNAECCILNITILSLLFLFLRHVRQ